MCRSGHHLLEEPFVLPGDVCPVLSLRRPTAPGGGMYGREALASPHQVISVVVGPGPGVGLDSVEESEVLPRHSLPVALVCRGHPADTGQAAVILSSVCLSSQSLPDPVTPTKMVLATSPDHSQLNQSTDLE